MSGCRVAWPPCCLGVCRSHMQGARGGRRLIAWRGGNTVSFSPPRIIDQRFDKVSYFVFGDFNFRLDSKSVVEVGTCSQPRWEPSPQSGVLTKAADSESAPHRPVQPCRSHCLYLRQTFPRKTFYCRKGGCYQK